MEDSQTQPVDSTQQVTSKTHTTFPKEKNPKQAAAGKAIAEKRKQARKVQKRVLVEAQSIIANNQLKQAATVDDPQAADPPPLSGLPADTKNVLTTTQWLSVISIFISLAGIHYKHKEIKSLLTKKTSCCYHASGSSTITC